MNADQIKFRASSTDALMTNDRSGKGMGDTCKKELMKVFCLEKYGRYEEINSKYLDKGNEREQDAITLLSRVTKKFLKKNEERLYNEYLTGVPDIYLGKSISEAEEVYDTKCSWSLLSFKNASAKDYVWQPISYMALTGAKKATVAFCLVNATEEIINDEKRKIGYKPGMMDAGGNHSPIYVEKCKQIEINHIFDMESFKKEYPWYDFANDLNSWCYDIPMEERVKTFTIERDEVQIQSLYQRVKDCRTYMNTNLFA
jgi:hypothetical protein